MQFAAIGRTVAEQAFEELDVGRDDQRRGPILGGQSCPAKTFVFSIATRIPILFSRCHGAVMLQDVVWAESFLEQVTIHPRGLLDNAGKRNYDDDPAETARVALRKSGIVILDMAQGKRQGAQGFCRCRSVR